MSALGQKRTLASELGMSALPLKADMLSEVFTGLEIDPASFQGLPKVLAEIKWADCGGTHNLFEVESRLADDARTRGR